MANTQSIDALRREIWSKELLADAMDDLYFMRNGLMGEDANNIVQVKMDLMNEPGDTVTFGLTTKLSSDGIAGDAELEGQEEQLSSYNKSVSIDQIRNAIRLTGKLDKKKAAYDMLGDAKDKVKIWMTEFLERQVFLKLAGIGNTGLTDITGQAVAGRATWSNTPDTIADADIAAGTGNRYICANSSGVASLTTSNVFSAQLISRAKRKAITANPRIQPLRIDGQNMYVMFIHPLQAYDLRHDSNSKWDQAQRDAAVRGEKNPIFTGAIGVYDGVIVYEHEYVPLLTTPGSSNRNFSSAGSGTTYAVRAARALLCGQQAALMAQASNPDALIIEDFDYKNKDGVAGSFIGGIQKALFNSKEYGVIAVDTSYSLTSF